MIEIADELERLAGELERSGDVLSERSTSGSFASGMGFAKRECAERLKRRATELRGQSSVRVRGPLPKPTSLRTDQRWISPLGHDVTVGDPAERAGYWHLRDDLGPYSLHQSELLTGDGWRFMSDGPEPAR